MTDPAPSPDPPVVATAGLSRTFSGPPAVHAVQDVDLRVRAGEYVSIVGPSGSGKSTLLHLIGLLDRPSAGSYHLDGVDTTTLSNRRRAELRARRLGFVFQAFHLLAHRSVLDNVVLATLYSGVPRDERRSRATTALEQVGLGNRVGFDPSTLSGGERQRVAIARALVTRPAVLLADEPTGNLDSATSGRLLDLLDRLHADGLTLVVVSHDRQVSRRARRRVRIIDGTLQAAA